MFLIFWNFSGLNVLMMFFIYLKMDNQIKNEILPKDSFHSSQQNLQSLRATEIFRFVIFNFCLKTIEFQCEVRVRYENRHILTLEI